MVRVFNFKPQTRRLNAGSLYTLKLSTPIRDIKAKIKLLTSAEGGRTTPAKSGYRPQFYYDGEHWDAAIELLDRQEIYPGESSEVYFQFATPKKSCGSTSGRQAV